MQAQMREIQDELQATNTQLQEQKCRRRRLHGEQKAMTHRLETLTTLAEKHVHPIPQSDVYCGEHEVLYETQLDTCQYELLSQSDNGNGTGVRIGDERFDSTHTSAAPSHTDGFDNVRSVLFVFAICATFRPEFVFSSPVKV